MRWQATEYLSPPHKVQEFLQRSRDLWRKKHHELKMQIKLAANQVRAVEKSRQMWRERAEAAEAELQRAKTSKNILHCEAS
jgi:response regulator RpfG family c-di-GMP phosphodiesterase